MSAEKPVSGSILVALDGSEPAQAAAKIAIRIAHSQNLMIRGLYVVDSALILDPYASKQLELGAAEEPSSRADFVARFERRGEEVLAGLRDSCLAAGVSVTTEMILGGVPAMVLREATASMLLALGRRGHGHAADPSHLCRHFLAIAHRAPCPFVVGGSQRRPPACLLVAYNDSERARHALTWAARLQRSLPADVIVLAVRESRNDTAEQWLQQAQDQLPPAELSHYRFVERADKLVAGIAAAATEAKADCIVIGGYRHTAAVEWLLGSTVDALLKHVSLPVFVA